MNTLRRGQRGSSIFMVLVALASMLLGGLALARMTEVGTLMAGNIAARNAALQASEVGVNNAYAALKALASDGIDVDTWYTNRLVTAQTPQGLPDIDWAKAPSTKVGPHTVVYVVERVCETASVVTDPYQQCLLREIQMPPNRSEDPTNREAQLGNPYAPQFRITTRVTDERNTAVFVQALVTKGSD